jgi:2-oxoglutarate ferredoxin oxidoreductase subunit beta
MTGGQQGPTTPLEALTATSPYGNIEHPFNLVHLAAASGSTYVARWTTLHVRRLTLSLKKMLQKRGFSFVEVLAPCPEIFGRHNKMRSGLEMMSWFRKASVIDSFSEPSKAEITSDRIVVGEFVDIEKLSYERMLHEKISKINEKAMERVS